MANTRFTPASIEAFKRTARDIHNACGNPLQECQDALSKGYGYADLHALQEHLKTHPTPGPYPDDCEDFAQRVGIRMGMPGRVLEYLKPLKYGRIGLDDIGLAEPPEAREVIMQEHRMVDELLAGKSTPEPDTETSEYLWFDHQEDQKEGVLRRTAKSEIIHSALVYLGELQEAAERGWGPSGKALNPTEKKAERDQVFETRRQIARIHPNSPYAQAGLLTSVFQSWGDDGPPLSSARQLWPGLQECRALFERVVPRGFRQGIEPELIGRSADNFPYIAVLYSGAICAHKVGDIRAALAWARKGRMLNKNDNFGFRFLVSSWTDVEASA